MYLRLTQRILAGQRAKERSITSLEGWVGLEGERVSYKKGRMRV